MMNLTSNPIPRSIAAARQFSSSSLPDLSASTSCRRLDASAGESTCRIAGAQSDVEGGTSVQSVVR